MHHPYLAFLLRLWQTGESSQGAWLASLEDPHTHQVTGFETLEGLYDYLKKLEANIESSTGTDSEAGLPAILRR